MTYIINYISQRRSYGTKKSWQRAGAQTAADCENGSSYTVTLPKELIVELGWQKRQKVVVSKVGQTLVIEDWQK